MDFIEIDGQEGGGQILRTSLSLSVILDKPIKIKNIRKNRPSPGLKNQHLTCINAMKEICNAEVEGAKINSQEITFIPNTIVSKEYTFDIQTAGSISLVIQTILPLVFKLNSKLKIKLKGGTHVPFSPTITYLEKVFLPVLTEIGIKAKINIKKYGFYPKGGGEVELIIWPINNILPININEDSSNGIKAEILLCNLPEHIAERESSILKEDITDIDIIIEKSFSPGNCITIYDKYKGATALGKIGVPAEKIAKQAYSEFKTYNLSIDKYLPDQLLIYMSLNNNQSEIVIPELTKHIEINMLTIQKFLGNIFEIKDHKIIKKEI